MAVDVLILNLTRFGDLLQSQPLITDLHHSGHRVGLVCLENFAPALPLLRHVQESFVLPAARLMREKDAHWQEAAVHTLAWSRQIRQAAAARAVINLTATLPARLLAKLLSPAPEALLGFGLDADGFGFNGGMWASFLCGASLKRNNAPFNLVDLFRKTGHSLCTPAVRRRAGIYALQTPPEAARNAARHLLTEGAPASEKARAFVAFQLGASEARRQWPVKYFAALGARLWQEARLCPVLLGTPSEQPLAQAYAAHSTAPFVDAVGKTDIPQLAALVQECALLVTNDTGTMHLAAGLGVASVAFFLASAQPWDTGPYLPQCCCLEPRLDCHPCPYNSTCPHENRCLHQITAPGVAELILHKLTHGSWQDGIGQTLRHQARVWLTDTDAHGFACVRTLSGQETEDRSIWLQSQRHFWRQLLDNLEQEALPPAAQSLCPAAETMPEIMPETAAHGMTGTTARALTECDAKSATALPRLSPTFREAVVPVLAQSGRLLSMLAEQAALAGRSATAGQLLLRNCERLQNLLNATPALASLANFWREVRQQRGDMAQLHASLQILAAHVTAWSAALTDDTAPCAG